MAGPVDRAGTGAGARTHGAEPVALLPLARGLLTGKYKRGESAPNGTRLAKQTHALEQANFDVIEALQAFADERGVSMLHIAIGALAALPTVGSVIAGATSVDQVTRTPRRDSGSPAATILITAHHNVIPGVS